MALGFQMNYKILYQITSTWKSKSVEVWQNDELVGGLYGVDLGHVFCGESMFSKVSNASKIAFVKLIDYLKENNYKLTRLSSS
jgi:leucyl/phenylalanyl-tRNA--protein transferase